MKRLLAIATLGASLFALPALADTVTVTWEVGDVRDQLGTIVPKGYIGLVIIDTERLGLSAFTSLSPAATLAMGGGLLQTDGHTHGYIADMRDIGYDYDMDGYIDGVFNLPTVPTWIAEQRGTLHTSDPFYVMWFPTLTDGTWDGAVSFAGTVGVGTWYGVFRDPSNPPAQGDVPGWIIPGAGSSTTEYANSVSEGGPWPDSDFNATYQTTPEPSTLLLLATGLLGLLAYARWKAK